MLKLSIEKVRICYVKFLEKRNMKLVADIIKGKNIQNSFSPIFDMDNSAFGFQKSTKEKYKE
jgi:hypothetical protein